MRVETAEELLDYREALTESFDCIDGDTDYWSFDWVDRGSLVYENPDSDTLTKVKLSVDSEDPSPDYLLSVRFADQWPGTAKTHTCETAIPVSALSDIIVNVHTDISGKLHQYEEKFSDFFENGDEYEDTTTVTVSLSCPECGHGSFEPLNKRTKDAAIWPKFSGLMCASCGHRWFSEDRETNLAGFQDIIDIYENAHSSHDVNSMDDWFEVAKDMKQTAVEALGGTDGN